MFARRLLAGAVTAAAAASAALLSGQSPAAAYEVSSISASSWAYTNSHDSSASFVKLAVDTPVGRQEPAGGTKYKARFYFTFDLARLNGKKLYEANLLARERSAADCTAPAPLELWRTAPIGSAPTWNNPPAELEKLGTPVPGVNYECPGYLVFDLRETVLAAQARGDAQLTLELRIADAAEGDRLFGRTFVYRPDLQYKANTVPVVSAVKLYHQNTCATQAAPTTVSGLGTTLSAKVVDPDVEPVGAEFATWPVDQPEQRRTYTGYGYSRGDIRRDVPTNVYAHGAVVAWSAQATDTHDLSEWAAPCYFTVDSVAPAKAPLVSSELYPQGGPASGGVGVPGTFVLDAQGDPDVVRYEFRDGQGGQQIVEAPAPGAPVTVTYTPNRQGQATLYARAIDRAGNRSPETSYSFLVRDTRPGVTVEMNGLHLTSRLLLTPTIEGVTEYRYRLDGGPEQTVPAGQDGKAVAELVFTEPGWPRLTVTSYTAAGPAGVWSETIRVSDAPAVGSSGYDGFAWHMALVGKPLTWTFRPGAPNVVAYEYQLNWDQELLRVDADTSGVAVFDWTPTEPGSGSR
ncbi:hypothetical protein ACFQZ4_26155 [Catellatospora coxensis]